MENCAAQSLFLVLETDPELFHLLLPDQSYFITGWGLLKRQGQNVKLGSLVTHMLLVNNSGKRFGEERTFEQLNIFHWF